MKRRAAAQSGLAQIDAYALQRPAATATQGTTGAESRQGRADNYCGAHPQADRPALTRCYNLGMPTPVPQSPPRPSAAMQPSDIAASKARERQTRGIITAAIVAAVVLVAILVLAVYVLLQPSTPTDRWRDIFIILVSLETLVIGVALVVLLVQVASLINLLQNEVRPILQATSDAVNNLRGTAEFLGESVVQPVIKVNTYVASIRRVLELIGIKHG